MKSPFPGMDPYIEECGFWEDFHLSLITSITDALAPLLPEKYVARTGERAYVVFAETECKTESKFQSDAGITTPATQPRTSSGASAVTVAESVTDTEPVTMCAFIVEEFKEAFIEILELHPERRLVTCIEVLSPSNKKPNTPGWDQYLRKRQALLMGEANFVEIDLLRGGTKMPMLNEWPKSPYTLLVARRERAPRCRVWPAHFHLPLPAIPIPLSAPDPDVTLALQPLVDAIYARRRYDQDIDYTRPLHPALPQEQIAWFQAQLQARTSRS